MAKVRVAAFGVSLDGFGAGPEQSLQNPLGVGFMSVMDWFFPTRVFRTIVAGQEGGETGVDNSMAEKSFENVGAWILGRNMFSPGRGKWDMDWKGWWGEEPPYHCPTFVLTHYPRDPLEMKGGTVFHFVTGEFRTHSIAPGLRPVGAMCAWGRCRHPPPVPERASHRRVAPGHAAVFLATAASSRARPADTGL
jgi:dihydrofolate reductase